LIDRAGTVLSASNSLLATAPNIVGKSVKEAFDIDPVVLSGGHERSGNYGVYANTYGELMPAMLQVLYEVAGDPGSTLVNVMDGAPFRRVETERFESTPFSVIRVSPDGIVRFANDDAIKTLARPSDETIGHPLARLFNTPGTEVLTSTLKECISKRSSKPLEVTSVSKESDRDEHLHLLLTPDIAPGNHVLGVVATIPSTLSRIRDDISRLALDPSIKSWKARIAVILERIRKIIEFDHANFGVYAENAALFRSLVIYPDDHMKWPSRWMELPPFIPEWVASGETWVGNVPQFVDEHPEFRKNEVTRHYLKNGIAASVSLVASDSKGPTSALSLCSLKANQYDAVHLKILRDLDLEAILIRIEEDVRRERQAFMQRMRKRIACATNLREASRHVVDEISEHFEWEYVALFRVNRRREQFELLHQNPCKRRFHIDEGYTQSFNHGMLWATLSSGEARTVNNIGSSKCNQYGYMSLGRPARSAMTIPIRLNGRIRWILDIETSFTEAFRGPDKRAIENLVEAIEQSLTQRTMRQIKEHLMTKTEQGVLVVGIEGIVLEMNPVAADLLGRSSCRVEEGETVFLKQYLDETDPRLKDVFSGMEQIDKQRIELHGDDGRTRTVLGTRKILDESFDSALWFLTDIETDHWTVDLGFLRETVSDVAQQTRASLALASAIACQLSTQWTATQVRPSRNATDQNNADGLCKQIVSELGKADITFERLAEGLAIRKHPVRSIDLFDLRYCVGDVINSMPERDRQRVDFQMPSTRYAVKGDAGRLAFVVRSLVAHLIRVRVDEESRIKIELRENTVLGETMLGLQLCPLPSTLESDTDEQGPSDALWRAYRYARDDASLATAAITAVVDGHHGKFEKFGAPRTGSDPSLRWTAFHVTLPWAGQEVSS
jgi:PAS domain-containing protein